MKPLEFIAFPLVLVLLVGLKGVSGLNIGAEYDEESKPKHPQDSVDSVNSASAADVDLIQALGNRSQIESVSSPVLTNLTAQLPKSEGSTPQEPVDLQSPVLPVPGVLQQLPAFSSPPPLDVAPPVLPIQQLIDLIRQILNLLLSVLPFQQPAPTPVPAPENSSYRNQSQSVFALPQLVNSSSLELIPNPQIVPLLALPNPQPSMPEKSLQLLSASQSPIAKSDSEHVIIPPIEPSYFALQQVEPLRQAPNALPPVSPVPALLLEKPVEISISGQSAGRQHPPVEKHVPPQFNRSTFGQKPRNSQATLDPVPAPAGVAVERKTCWTTVLGRFLRRKPNC